MGEEEKYAQIKRRPLLYPIYGLIVGLVLWVLDALIDVYLLNEEQDLLENIFTPELTEAWMRALVLILFVGFGFAVRRLVLKQHPVGCSLVGASARAGSNG